MNLPPRHNHIISPFIRHYINTAIIFSCLISLQNAKHYHKIIPKGFSPRGKLGLRQEIENAVTQAGDLVMDFTYF